MFVDIFFGPTDSFLDLFSFYYGISKNKLVELMPGLSFDNTIFNKIYNEHFNDNKLLNLIYVGGVYDNKELLKCFKDLYLNNVNQIFLYFITRLNELPINYKKEILSIPLIKLLEFSKNDLTKYYDLSSIASLFFKAFLIKKGQDNIYHDYLSLAVPVKFMEYLENLKPVITHSEAFVSKIVKEYDIGWVIDYNYLALKELLLYLLNNKQEIVDKRKNILKVLNKYSWENVAKKIVDNLKYL